MKTTKKIAVALVGFTGIALASMWTFAANTKTFIVHQAHKHNEALTGNFTWNHLNLLPFHFEKITAQVDLNTADWKVIKGEKKWNKSHDEIDEDDMNTFHGGALWFLWNFLDDSQLTQDQKDEIQVLQIKKQQDMAELLNKMI